MTKPIPETNVEKTWQEIIGFSPDRAKKEMTKFGNNQPESGFPLYFLVASSICEKTREFK